jgi:hypothetical protein
MSSGDRNVIKKEAKNVLKYKDISVEIQRSWNVIINVIPVITGATKPISITQTVPEQRKRKARNEGTQKTAILGCAHTAGSANVNVQNIFHRRNNITCSTNCKYRTAAKLRFPVAWFVSGI